MTYIFGWFFVKRLCWFVLNSNACLLLSSTQLVFVSTWTDTWDVWWMIFSLSPNSQHKFLWPKPFQHLSLLLLIGAMSIVIWTKKLLIFRLDFSGDGHAEAECEYSSCEGVGVLFLPFCLWRCWFTCHVETHLSLMFCYLGVFLYFSEILLNNWKKYREFS